MLCDGWFRLLGSWPPALGVSWQQASPHAFVAAALRREEAAARPARQRARQGAPAQSLEKEGAPPPRELREATPAPAPVATTTTIPSRVELRRRAGLTTDRTDIEASAGRLTEASVPLGTKCLEIPARWQKVPDCERPNKWRELMDDEDCKFEKQQKKLLGEGKKINDPVAKSFPN